MKFLKIFINYIFAGIIRVYGVSQGLTKSRKKKEREFIMKDDKVNEYRIANFRKIAGGFPGGRKALAEKIGITYRYVGHLCSFKASFGAQVARSIESNLDLPDGFLDYEDTDKGVKSLEMAEVFESLDEECQGAILDYSRTLLALTKISKKVGMSGVPGAHSNPSSKPRQEG